MSTDTLIAQLLETSGDATAGAIQGLRELLGDSTLDDLATPLTVTEAAQLVRLSSHTLRYYEREGLVTPGRNASGYREYSAFDLRRLVFLSCMRVSGMTMHDLKRYIALAEQGAETVPERRRMMLDQRDRIRGQLRELTLSLEATEFKIRTYGGAPEG